MNQQELLLLLRARVTMDTICKYSGDVYDGAGMADTMIEEGHSDDCLQLVRKHVQSAT